MKDNYRNFLESKVVISPETGFDISEDEINSVLKPHQRAAVKWAVKGGKRALFEKFGLGKTVQELEFCRIVTEKKGGRALIVLPLGVKQEFIRDAVTLLGMSRPEYVRNDEEIRASESSILLMNYERLRDGNVDLSPFTAVCLDEASVLRSFGSKTYQTFLPMFRGIPFKLVATATPDPNRYKELIHYAAFLEIMDSGQALTRFFKRDSKKAGNLNIYPHKEKEFWLWVSSWALFLSKPSDLGFDDTGYDLPELRVSYHKIPSPNALKCDGRTNQVQLINNVSAGLVYAAKEKRESIDVRLSEMKKIVDSSPNDSFILWHDLEEERRRIKSLLPEAVEVYGSLDMDLKEQRVIDFSEGKIRLLATKKEISGQGCNFQRHCHRAIFVGIDYEFNDFIQAIHRIYRFMQTYPVTIDIIYTENEQPILDELLAKWERYDEQSEKMREIMRKNGLSSKEIIEKMERSIGIKRKETVGEHFTAVNNDCVIETKSMKSNSVGLIVSSIPFSNHYEYSPSYNDFGHNDDNGRFFEQMDYLTPELLRVLQPGRLACIHVKDRVLFGAATGDGMPTIDPFSDMTVFHFMKHGFKYMGRITVTTDVVRENNQTYRLGWSEQCKDGSKMGVGCPEYILLFRKLPSDTSKAYADVPVVKSKDDYTRAQWQIDAHAFWRSDGNFIPEVKEIPPEKFAGLPMSELQKTYSEYSRSHVYDYDKHIGTAKILDEKGKLPATFMSVAPASTSGWVWDDINRMNTLNSSQSKRNQTLHICPLQIDIVKRLINRYSNKGDVVYDPFGGLMTVPVYAVKLGRYGIGCELNPESYDDGVKYLKESEAGEEQLTFFDLIG